MKKTIAILLALVLLTGLCSCGTAAPADASPAGASHFDLAAFSEADRAAAASLQTQYLVHFGGYVGERVEGNLKNWLYNAYDSNPLMLDSVRQKGITEIAENVMFWFGMYAPGIMRGAAGCWKMEHDEKLYETIEKLVEDSIRCIETYGSLEYDADSTEFPLINPSWLNGVMAWYNATGSEKALELAVMIGDYYIEKAEERGINDTMPMIGLAQLCIATNEPRFAKLLDQYLLAWSWTGGDYHNAAQSGTEYPQLLRNNWENIFEVEALGPIGTYLQDESYYDSLRFMYESVVLYERRSTGANTTGEGSVGTPYGTGSAETCGNVTWLEAMSELAKVQKQPDVIDELELTFYNAVLGAQDVAGRWWTYDTPQEGYKLAAIKYLNWQIAQGAPEFSCCMSNCALGIGTLAEWAAMRDENGIYVNYYGDSEMVIATPAGNLVKLTQDTSYPSDGSIRLTVNLEQDEEFKLNLRIPVWSENSSVKLNGSKLETPAPGCYYGIQKLWKNGDVLELSLDMSLHYWAAGESFTGFMSVYSGPVLLTLDQRFNPGWDSSRKKLDLETIRTENVECATYPETMILATLEDAEGNELTLCDFATAGQSGTYYTTWFRTDQLSPAVLARNECCWNQRYTQD